MVRFAAVLLVGLASTYGVAQEAAQAPTQGAPVELRTSAQIQQQAAELMKEAKVAPGKDKSVKLDVYPGHYTMLATRAGSGGAEVHDHFSDFFIAQEGEATILIGGTIVDRKDTGNGEIRGTKLEGATPYVMHKGDVIHISPGVPHQTTVPAGKTFTYFVIKVEAAK